MDGKISRKSGKMKDSYVIKKNYVPAIMLRGNICILHVAPGTIIAHQSVSMQELKGIEQNNKT